MSATTLADEMQAEHESWKHPTGRTYRVVSITNNPAEYPESADDSLEFPDLVADVDDEQQGFVVWFDADGDYTACPIEEFFQSAGGYIRSFVVTEASD